MIRTVLLFVAGFAIAVIAAGRRLAKEVSGVLMPAISSVSGFAHDKKGLTGTERLLRPVFLPVQNTIKTEDLIVGQIGAIRFSKVEVDISDVRRVLTLSGRWRTRRTKYFDGYVFLIEGTPAPVRTIVATTVGRGARALGEQLQDGDTRASTISDHIGPAGEPFRLYTYGQQGDGHPPSSEAFLDRILKIDAQLPAGQSVFSATWEGSVTSLAIASKRNLYSFSGLLMTKKGLRAELDRALTDLKEMLATLSILIPAERMV